MLGIAYDHEKDIHFVYDPEDNNAVIYTGSYTNCLIVLGYFIHNPEATMMDCKDDMREHNVKL